MPISRLFHSPIMDLRPNPGAPEVCHRNLGVLLVEQLLPPAVPVVLQQSLRASAKLQVCLDEVPSLLRLYCSIMIVVQLMMKRFDGSQPCFVSLTHSGFKGSIFRIPINSLLHHDRRPVDDEAL